MCELQCAHFCLCAVCGGVGVSECDRINKKGEYFLNIFLLVKELELNKSVFFW